MINNVHPQPYREPEEVVAQWLQWYEANGQPRPSIRQMARNIGLKRSRVHDCLKRISVLNPDNRNINQENKSGYRR